ncbi:MAG: sodium:solute symporter, partial [Nitrospinota bacterium]
MTYKALWIGCCAVGLGAAWWTGDPNWLFLVLYGLVMVFISPLARSEQEFFMGARPGRSVGFWPLASSALISWIFAKSITNAANLGQAFGIVGGLAYATYYLSFIVAGVIIYRIRTTTGHASLASFLTERFGPGATLAFTLAIVIRLYNEVWSNTAVVASYFGSAGSAPYILAAVVITAFTLSYSLKGGLKSSIVTDMVQLALAAGLLLFILSKVIPSSGSVTRILTLGDFTLKGGLDLVLVALLQSLSYPFHDPVLTDRAFISEPRTMRGAFCVAGLAGIGFITLFSLVGVFAKLKGLAGPSTLATAQFFGLPMLIIFNVIMLTSAGSTLDSTFSSVSRLAAHDITPMARLINSQRLLRARTFLQETSPVTFGQGAMVVIALLGNLPLIANPAILKATTISGTMVMGLAPVFCFYWIKGAGRLSFHLAFWTGLALGVVAALGRYPRFLAIGLGK